MLCQWSVVRCPWSAINCASIYAYLSSFLLPLTFCFLILFLLLPSSPKEQPTQDDNHPHASGHGEGDVEAAHFIDLRN